MASRMQVLERERILGSLLGHLEQAGRGRGQLVLLHGEAGVGRSTVIRRLTELVASSTRTLIGSCDPLTTPRPFGSLVDIAPDLGDRVVRAVADVLSAAGGPGDVFRCLLESLGASGRAGGSPEAQRPMLLTFEDVHWADDDTLDLLCYLGRRIENTPVLLVATYRDDQVGRRHPLTALLGQLATCPWVHPYKIPPLSRQAVAQLAAGRPIDVDRLYEVTKGNPFFVTEVLTTGGREIPASVRQTVLGRLARLSKKAYAVVEAVALIGTPAPLRLISAMVLEPDDAVSEALSAGVLLASGRDVSFNNELARMAVVEAIPDYRRIQLHALVLEALESSPNGEDLTHLAYHAEEAENSAAALTYALAAARHASAGGAHREAVEQHDRALRHAASLRWDERADVLASRAHECYLAGDVVEAIASWQEAVRMCRDHGDSLREGDNLRWISTMLWLTGDMGQAVESGRQAVSVLATLEPGRELAWAYANMCQLAAYTQDVDSVAAHAHSAIILGERLDEPGVVLSARFHRSLAGLIHTGRGWEELEEFLREAVEKNLKEQSAVFATLLCLLAMLNRDFDRAIPATEQALAYCLEHDLTTFAAWVRGIAAVGMLHRGLWGQAVDAANAVLARANLPSVSRILPLTVLGLVRARRGDPEQWSVLDEALSLSERACPLQSGLVLEARAEAAWLKGEDAGAVAEVHRGLAAAGPSGSTWLVGGLARWVHRTGGTPPDVPMPDVLAWEIGGDWQKATAAWEEAGCDYDAALVRLDGDVSALRKALATFTAMEARPAAARARARLRVLGVRQAASGPRAETRTNPCLLTSREMEILALLRENLSDAEIAARLYITRKTVSHHVSAVLAKVGGRTRYEAVRRFEKLVSGPEL
ncbi:MAG TPA: AAA family ATPase [Kineosporiaceae bacterium]